MNLKDCVGFSDSLVLSQKRLVVGVISAMVEKELGERNIGFDSLKSRLKRYMEEKAIVAVCRTAVSSLRVHVFSPTHTLFRPLGRMQAGLLLLLCRWRRLHTTERSEQ